MSLSHLHHQKHNRESHFGRFGDEVHRHRMVREPASGIFRQVDENGLQTDEEAVRGDQAEREQTLLIILRRRGVWDVSLAAKGALLVMEFVRERRRRLVVVLVVERPPPRSEEKEDIDRVQRSMVPLSIQTTLIVTMDV